LAAKKHSKLNPPIAKKLQALFAQYPNVSYVIASHEHLFYNATGKTLQPVDRTDPSANGPSYVVTGGAGAKLDSCPDPTPPNCKSYHHYLAFEVDQDTVRVQVVAVDSN
jgi:hypothetical protein